MKKRVKKGIAYNPKPTPKKILITFLALILGNIIFSYIATTASGLSLSALFFNPAIVSTSILLAAASYMIISLVKE
ncbi:MAG: hypothetical protein KKD18_06540 [Nanoarchaeota archaeon]|nr:hypothetical protein [Nanoarchaeota archaeon]MBU0978051.1 hypothetical protein [Nanoarchaeota archaeon]